MQSSITTQTESFLTKGLMPALLATAILSLGTASPALAGGDKDNNPHIFPPQSHPYGKSFGAWGAEWWKWVYSIPADDNPITDPTGDFGSLNQSGPVWFLAGTFGTTVERTITIPEGKGIFFPIFNYFNDYPCPDSTFHPAPGQTLEAFLAAGAAAWVEQATALAVQVDGMELHHPFNYRAASHLVTFTADPSWLALDACVTPGQPQVGVSDGYWVMLAPLPKGEHTIHILATADQFRLDVTYHINVGKPPHIAPPDHKAYGKTLTEWLETYWRWYYTGADPAQSKVRHVQLMPLPAGDYVSGTGTPTDPALYRGSLEITLAPGTPFVLPQFAWVWERYNNGTPDDVPMDDAVALAGAHPVLTIDGLTVLSDENKAAFYVPVTPFDPIVVYPAPSSYGSIAALSFQGVGIVGRPLSEGVHVIHLYEPLIIPAGAFYLLPEGSGLIYDNTWTITVAKPTHGNGDHRH